jgi:hypothetical protein
MGNPDPGPATDKMTFIPPNREYRAPGFQACEKVQEAVYYFWQMLKFGSMEEVQV